MKVTKKHIILSMILLVVALALANFYHQVRDGLIVTGLNEPVIWGLYVVSFVTCMAMGAGIIIVMTLLAAWHKLNERLLFLSSCAAFTSVMLGGLFIFLDLGKMSRVYLMVTQPNYVSPVIWEFWINLALIGLGFGGALTSYAIISQSRVAQYVQRIILWIGTVKRPGKKFMHQRRPMYFFALLTLILYALTTEVFMQLRFRPHWHTPFFGAVFVVSAIMGGVCFVVFLGTIIQKHRPKTLLALKKWLLFLLVLDLALMLGKYARDSAHPEIGMLFEVFPHAFLLFLLIGNVIPIFILLLFRKNAFISTLVVPAVVVLGILAKRAQLIIPAYYLRNLPLPTAQLYVPSLPEVMMAFGVFTGGILILIVAYDVIIRAKSTLKNDTH